MRRSSPQPPTPTPTKEPGARKSQTRSEEPQLPPGPLQVDRHLVQGRHSPCTVLECPPAGSTCLPDRRSSTTGYPPQAGFSSLPNPLLATRYLLAALTALHSFIRACCRRPPIPHSLLCTFQSNPIHPAVLSFYRPPIPARTSCRASIVSQTLFFSPCAALRPQHPIDCQSSYCPTVCQTSPSETGGDLPVQPSPAQPKPGRPSHRETASTLPPPVTRHLSNQPPPQSATLPPRHC